MKLKTYYRNLSKADRKAYAERAQTSVGYLENHLIHARKQPRKELMERLSTASNGEVSFDDILSHFFKEAG